MAAFFKSHRSLFGGAVAATIGKGLVDTGRGHHDDRALCCASAFGWNIADVVVGLAIKFKSRTDRRTLRRRTRFREERLVSIKWNEGVWPKVVLPMIASPVGRLRVRRGLHVFVTYRGCIASTPQFVSFAIWKTANLQRGLDGP